MLPEKEMKPRKRRLNVYEMPERLKRFFTDEDFSLTADEVGRISATLLETYWTKLKGGQEEKILYAQFVEDFTKMSAGYVAGVKHAFWQEFKRLYDAGVIKKSALIEYLMKSEGFSREEALKYVAETFGMNPSTQSVYSSGEFDKRQKEKIQTRTKKM